MPCFNSVVDMQLCKSSSLLQHSRVVNRKIVRRYQCVSVQSVLGQMTFVDDEWFCRNKFVDMCSDL